MVRALLAGTKTQTRRLVDLDSLRVTLPRAVSADFPGYGGADAGRHRVSLNPQGAVAVLRVPSSPLGVKPGEFDFVCPYADGVTRLLPDRKTWEVVPHSGQRLWVKETFAFDVSLDDMRPTDISPACCREYFADGARANHREAYERGKTRVSIHMPRWASRLLLEVTEVRVERVQSISEEDARAEGLKAITKDGHTVKYGIPDRDGLPGTDNDGWPWQEWEVDPRSAYAKLWDAINGAGSWDANPWVWAVSFRRVQP